MTSEESFHNNYGALLQGYALFSTVSSFGFDTKIIRYKGESKPPKNSLLKNPITRKIKYIIKKIQHAITPKCYNKKLFIERERSFLQFQKDHMAFYNTKKWNYKKLCKLAPLGYAYVCGSDQIWNPSFRNDWCERGYFLSFCDDSCKRIAYAPSLGVSALSKAVKEQMRPLLLKFDALSSREQTGADLLAETSGKAVPVVLDPTLILDRDKWLSLAEAPKEPIPENYILVYHFSEENDLHNTVINIAKERDWDIISIPLTKTGFNDHFKNIYASPEEFIYLIKNARLVCTDSFHATVFSIITKTPFLTFLRESFGNGTNMNSRVKDLLYDVALDSRIVYSGTRLPSLEMTDFEFENAHKVLDEKKEFSLSYLKTALEIPDERN